MARICKVLIVEDQEELRAVFGGVFEAEGFEFDAVATGAEMRAALADGEYDIVVIDVVLPGGEDGFALADAARDEGRGVILTTGDHRHGERLAASGHRHLLKPFELSRLVGLADSVLRDAEATCVRRHRGGAGLTAPAIL